VLESLSTCQAQLAELAELIQMGEEEELGTALGLIREKRKEMFP
jgi:hypothetical protein